MDSSQQYYKFRRKLPRLCFLSSLLILLSLPTAWAQDFTIQSGNIPIIVVSVHGGWQKLSGARVREKGTSQDPRFSKKKDLVTYKLARLYKSRLSHHLGSGMQPSWLANRVHRKYVDLNRNSSHSSELSTAREYHQTFHNQLKAEISRLKQQFDWIVILDIHGQTAVSTDLIVGTQRGASTEDWAEKLMWGRGGVLETLNSAEYSTQPKHPKQAFRFAGGYITKYYGRDRAIQVFQLEHGKALRFDRESNENFVDLFSQTLTRSLKESMRIEDDWFFPKPQKDDKISVSSS